MYGSKQWLDRSFTTGIENAKGVARASGETDQYYDATRDVISGMLGQQYNPAGTIAAQKLAENKALAEQRAQSLQGIAYTKARIDAAAQANIERAIAKGDKKAAKKLAKKHGLPEPGPGADWAVDWRDEVLPFFTSRGFDVPVMGAPGESLIEYATTVIDAIRSGRVKSLDDQSRNALARGISTMEEAYNELLLDPREKPDPNIERYIREGKQALASIKSGGDLLDILSAGGNTLSPAGALYNYPSTAISDIFRSIF